MKRYCEFILKLLSFKIHEYIGIILISVGANILAAFILTPKENLLIYLALSSIFFSIGVFFLILSEQLKKISLSFEQTENLMFEEHKFKYSQLKPKYRCFYYYIPGLLIVGIFLLYFSTVSNSKNSKNDFANIATIDKNIPYDKKWARFYDGICVKNNHHLNQTLLVEKIINSFKKDTVQAIDVAAGTGDLFNHFSKYQQYVFFASDGSKDMIEYALSKHNLNNNAIIKVAWQDLGSSQLLPSNRFDVVLILGNSISYIKDEEELRDILTNLFSLLKEDGQVVIDFDFNLHRDYSPFAIYVDGNDYKIDISSKQKNEIILLSYSVTDLNNKVIHERTEEYNSNLTDSTYVVNLLKEYGKVEVVEDSLYQYRVFTIDN